LCEVDFEIVKDYELMLLMKRSGCLEHHLPSASADGIENVQNKNGFSRICF